MNLDTKDCRMVDRDAPFGHHRFEISVADRVLAVPKHRPQQTSSSTWSRGDSVL